MLFVFPRLESFKAALFELHRSRLLVWAASKGAAAAEADYKEDDDEAKKERDKKLDALKTLKSAQLLLVGAAVTAKAQQTAQLQPWLAMRVKKAEADSAKATPAQAGRLTDILQKARARLLAVEKAMAAAPQMSKEDAKTMKETVEKLESPRLPPQHVKTLEFVVKLISTQGAKANIRVARKGEDDFVYADILRKLDEFQGTERKENFVVRTITENNDKGWTAGLLLDFFQTPPRARAEVELESWDLDSSWALALKCGQHQEGGAEGKGVACTKELQSATGNCADGHDSSSVPQAERRSK